MAYLKNNFSLELKSLALFRIGLACVCGLALFPWAGKLDDDLPGGLPMLQNLPFQGVSYVTYLLTIAILLTSLALAAGYRTRLTTGLCFSLCSIAYGYGLGQFTVLGGVLLPALFWGIFLPLGAIYSLDSAMNMSPHPWPRSVLSSATLALIVQQGLNYGVTDSLGKMSLLNTNWQSPLQVTLAIFVGLGGLLLFWPWRVDVCRQILVLLFVSIHCVAFFFLGQSSLLSLLAVTTWLAFIPRALWQKGEQTITTPQRRGLAIYYDADCGFCKKVVHVLRTLLILPGTPLTKAQSDRSICQDMENHNSWVVVDWTQKRHFKFEAIAYVCSLSPLFNFLAPALKWSPVMAAGTCFYETIANNRQKAALFTKFLTFKTNSITPSKLENLVVGTLLVVFVIISLQNVVANVANTQGL